MIDKYKIDDHKLMFHIKRVNDWQEGKNIYPIYAEVSPSGACNHRCTFCGVDTAESSDLVHEWIGCFFGFQIW